MSRANCITAATSMHLETMQFTSFIASYELDKAATTS